MIELIIGYSLALASTLTVVMVPIKLFKTRNSHGVSFLTSVFAFYSMVFWTGYTAQLGDIPAYFSSIGPLICWGLSLVGIALSRGVRKLPLSILSILVVLSSLIIIELPTNILAPFAVGGSLFWALPQLRKAIKDSDLTGVSSISYFAIFLENLGWVIYAILTTHLSYAIAPLFQGPVAFLIALKAKKKQSRTSTSIKTGENKRTLYFNRGVDS